MSHFSHLPPSSCRALVQIRHPFDILVSGFFEEQALAASGKHFAAPHSIQLKPGETFDANAYALDAWPHYRRQLEGLLAAVEDFSSGCKVWVSHYEDMVYSDSTGWVDRLVDFLNLTDHPEEELATRALFHEGAKPFEKNGAKDQPGAYLDELKTQTITKLSKSLGGRIQHTSGYF